MAPRGSSTGIGVSRFSKTVGGDHVTMAAHNEETSMTSHPGSCHCGAVTFEARTDLSERIMCNCSLCGRAGTLYTFMPATDLTVHGGEESLTDYQFGRKTIHHTFCSVCGVRPFARGTAPDGTEMVGVNVGCLEGVDRNALEPTMKYDGRSL